MHKPSHTQSPRLRRRTTNLGPFVTNVTIMRTHAALFA